MLLFIFFALRFAHSESGRRPQAERDWMETGEIWDICAFGFHSHRLLFGYSYAYRDRLMASQKTRIDPQIADFFPKFPFLPKPASQNRPERYLFIFSCVEDHVLCVSYCYFASQVGWVGRGLAGISATRQYYRCSCGRCVRRTEKARRILVVKTVDK